MNPALYRAVSRGLSYETAGRAGKIRRMKMHKIIIALLVALIVSVARAQAPVDAEANSVAKKLWDSILTKCGGSYFYLSEEQKLDEMRGISFEVRPWKLSAADRANGTKWYGAALIGHTLSRRYDNDEHEWGRFWDGQSTKEISWNDTTTSGAPEVIYMTKKNGKWSFSVNSFLGSRPFDPSQIHKPACSDVPGLSSRK
jgi:hypothetical protein